MQNALGYRCGGYSSLRNRNQMLMVSEEQNLSMLSEFTENLEACSRTIVVIVDEQIIREEWQTISTRDFVFDCRNPDVQRSKT